MDYRIKSNLKKVDLEDGLLEAIGFLIGKELKMTDNAVETCELLGISCNGRVQDAIAGIIMHVMRGTVSDAWGTLKEKYDNLSDGAKEYIEVKK